MRTTGRVTGRGARSARSSRGSEAGQSAIRAGRSAVREGRDAIRQAGRDIAAQQRAAQSQTRKARRFTAEWFAEQRRKGAEHAAQRQALIAELARKRHKTSGERLKLARLRSAEKSARRVAKSDDKRAARVGVLVRHDQERMREALIRRFRSQFNRRPTPEEFALVISLERNRGEDSKWQGSEPETGFLQQSPVEQQAFIDETIINARLFLESGKSRLGRKRVFVDPYHFMAAVLA